MRDALNKLTRQFPLRDVHAVLVPTVNPAEKIVVLLEPGNQDTDQMWAELTSWMASEGIPYACD